jgi:hypothetical protein
MILNEKHEIQKNDTPEHKCINMDYIKRLTKSNPALMMEMISLYLEQTPALIRNMKESTVTKDWNLLQAAAHKLIPSFSIVGIHPDFEIMAKKVQEYAGTQQHTDKIPDLVVQLESVCNQACAELTEEYSIIKNSAR